MREILGSLPGDTGVDTFFQRLQAVSAEFDRPLSMEQIAEAFTRGTPEIELNVAENVRRAQTIQQMVDERGGRGVMMQALFEGFGDGDPGLMRANVGGAGQMMLRPLTRNLMNFQMNMGVDERTALERGLAFEEQQRNIMGGLLTGMTESTATQFRRRNQIREDIEAIREGMKPFLEIIERTQQENSNDVRSVQGSVNNNNQRDDR